MAVRTAFKLVGYGRRISKKSGFSDDPDVIAERLAFAREGVNWTQERLNQQLFSDEVWAHGGAHTQEYITVKEDGSDRFKRECVQHKYSKLPSWMFHGVIVGGKKGPAVFWEKDWGSMNSEKYDAVILNNIQAFIQAHEGEHYIWMQDNASCHRSKATQANLRARRIPTILWPRYSPDLNLIEHVWNWMKNYIQRRYYAAYYDAAKVPKERLRAIIWEAWEAVPDSYIQTLFNSWWSRCQAVIDAQGGPTKY
jgi:DDE superfamily endonuclease